MNLPWMRRGAFILMAGAALAGCVYPAPVYAPAPSTFDRAFNAAVGAATDSGVAVTSADRPSGRITGTKDGAAVTINLATMANGNVRVEFNAPGSLQTNPTLAEQMSAAYQRRMGR
jgi:hypothetical protein